MQPFDKGVYDKRYEDVFAPAITAAGIDPYRVDRALAVGRTQCHLIGVKAEEVWAEGKYRPIVEARSLLCYWAVRELGVSMSSLARRLGISIPAVSDSVTRGRRIAEARRGVFLIET